MVLAEVFTGSGCPPCAAADLAFDAAMERYARKDLAVVMYHQHIPAPDPMTTVETTARKEFYAVRGVPTFAIDGKDTIGGGPRQFAKDVYDKFQKDLEKELETPAEARLKLDAGLNGNTVRVSAAVDQVKSESKVLRVHILLIERSCASMARTGPLPTRWWSGHLRERCMLGRQESGQGQFFYAFDLDKVSKAIKDHLDDYEGKGHRGETFKFTEKKYQINRANLAVVVFVQDKQDKKPAHILQAAWADLGPAGAHPTTEANGSQVQ
jgi:thiol-disulfide isomerase/thioredoxin